MEKSQQGFTIIELVVVIAIIAILSAIVTVNVQSYISKAKLSRINTETNNIGKAVLMFYTQYGDYPKNGGAGTNAQYYPGVEEPYLVVNGQNKYLSDILNMDLTEYNAEYLAPGGHYEIGLFDNWPYDGKIGCGHIILFDENYCWYGAKYIITQDCDYSEFDTPFIAEDLYPEDSCGGYGFYF
jgi:prepilin-type N-terminal cleavage/methylation domain-containing protein